jgi:hypothetical protein
MNRFVPTPSRGLLIAFAASFVLAIAIANAQAPQTSDPTVTPAPATESAAKATVAPSSAEGLTAPLSPALKAPASPMMIEMQAVMTAEREKVAELRARADKASTPDEAVAIQREIERVKFDSEISLLRVQAKHARAAGRTQVATSIEAAINELLSPPKLAAPAARPVPTRENTSH